MNDVIENYEKLLRTLGFEGTDIEKYAQEISNLGDTYTLAMYLEKVNPEYKEKFDEELSKCKTAEELKAITEKCGISYEWLNSMRLECQKKAVVDFINELLKNLTDEEIKQLREKLSVSFPEFSN